MVTVTIYVEGGVLDFQNQDAATVSNTESLRQAFHRIFSALCKDEVSIIVIPCGGYKSAVKLFLTKGKNNDSVFVDLDSEKSRIPHWFDTLQKEGVEVSVARRKYVFFMIQEMEAWILKQPECIALWANRNGFVRKHESEKIEFHPSIKDRDIESIQKPSEKLGLIIRHFYARVSSDGQKTVRYGKLKHSPAILDCLNVDKLMAADSELQRFNQMMSR